MAKTIQSALDYSADKFQHNTTVQTFSDIKDDLSNLDIKSTSKDLLKKSGQMLSDGAMNKINSIAINPAKNFLESKVTNARQQTQGEASYGIIDNSAQILANAYVMAETGYALYNTVKDVAKIKLISEIAEGIISEVITYTTDQIISYSDKCTVFLVNYPSVLLTYTTERVSYHFNSNLMTKEEIMQKILEDTRTEEDKAKQDEKLKKENANKKTKKSVEEKLKEFTDKFNEVSNKINTGMQKAMYWIEEGPEWVEKQAKNYVTFGMNTVKRYVGIGIDEFDKNMKAGADALAKEIGEGLAKASNAIISAGCKALNDQIKKDRKKIDSKTECAKAKVIIELAGILGS